MLGKELEFSLNQAFKRARERRHEFLTVEHLLLALLDNPAAVEVLRACGADLERLRRDLDAFAAEARLAQYTPIADVVIGAVLIPGERAPFLVTEKMVHSMKKGSVIVDVSIDQGGCVETSRPTTPDQPTFKVHGVTHFCVPNMTANAPRTASRAMSLAALPFLARLAEEGLESALRSDPGFARGAYTYRGRLVNDVAAAALGLASARLSDLLS